MYRWIALRCGTSKRPSSGAASSSTSRDTVALASKSAKRCGSKMCGMFRRTSVPGYLYGSEFPGIQCSNLRAHLLECQLTRHVSVEDRLGGIGRLKPFQPHRGFGPFHTSPALVPFLRSEERRVGKE